jgi:hypothetical protein
MEPSVKLKPITSSAETKSSSSTLDNHNFLNSIDLVAFIYPLLIAYSSYFFILMKSCYEGICFWIEHQINVINFIDGFS